MPRRHRVEPAVRESRGRCQRCRWRAEKMFERLFSNRFASAKGRLAQAPSAKNEWCLWGGQSRRLNSQARGERDHCRQGHQSGAHQASFSRVNDLPNDRTEVHEKGLYGPACHVARDRSAKTQFRAQRSSATVRPSRFEVEMKHVEHLDKNTQTRKGTNVQSSHIDRKRATVAGLTLAVLVLVVVVVVVVQGSKKSPATSTQRLRPEVVLKTHQSSKHGTYLVNDQGFTLYTYQLDTDDHSYCVNYCLHMWPALTVAPGRSPVAHGVSDLGFITRSSGVHQVTYKGHPLYTFQIDVLPGQTLGNHGPWSIVRISKAAN
jgi:predicted lipoprotein with Yx(FWY)xxD motif